MSLSTTWVLTEVGEVCEDRDSYVSVDNRDTLTEGMYTVPLHCQHEEVHDTYWVIPVWVCSDSERDEDFPDDYSCPFVFRQDLVS